tara:strand:- start:337 stop:882 length:546 start_codon:yes stop_codon:yes gene_type:complete
MKVIVALVILIATGATLWFSNQGEVEIENSQTHELPIISRQQILTATDLVEGVKKSLQEHDEKAISQWLNKALALAKEANMPQEDIDYIQSDMAKNFVIFQAQRSMFNDAVEQAYYDLLNIEDIKADFPQAEDLFASADKLIAKRDKIIEQIAAELSTGDAPTDADRQAARQQWLMHHSKR